MRFTLSLVGLVTASAVQAACPGQTQLEMNECSAEAFVQADDELNTVWTQAKSFMDGIGQGPALLDAQRKWLAFRDAACAAEIAPYDGGSIQPLILNTCLTRLTQARVRDLENFRF